MTTDSRPAGQDGLADPAAALADRLFHDMIGALELFTVYLGERLGLYRALATEGPATSTELAERTGVRPWLVQHRDRAGVSPGHGRRFRPRRRCDRRRPPLRRRARSSSPMSWSPRRSTSPPLT